MLCRVCTMSHTPIALNSAATAKGARKTSERGMSAAKTTMPAMLRAIAAYRIVTSPMLLLWFSLGAADGLRSGERGQNRRLPPPLRYGTPQDNRDRRTRRIGASHSPLRTGEAAWNDQQG